ncbi:hypothetical protein X942_5813 [Burkholderia pseudomallei MSHR5596]|nr:hypothetical protein X942_5813 [Burkholderia pseudomallei MSHR5596]
MRGLFHLVPTSFYVKNNIPVTDSRTPRENLMARTGRLSLQHHGPFGTGSAISRLWC